MSDHLTPAELEVLPRMRIDVDRFDAFRADDVRVLLDIIDRLDHLLRAEPSRSSPDPDALAVDLGQTHDHEIGVHDSFELVFRAQAEALIARGWRLGSSPDLTGPAREAETG